MHGTIRTHFLTQGRGRMTQARNGQRIPKSSRRGQKDALFKTRALHENKKKGGGGRENKHMGKKNKQNIGHYPF